MEKLAAYLTIFLSTFQVFVCAQGESLLEENLFLNLAFFPGTPFF